MLLDLNREGYSTNYCLLARDLNTLREIINEQYNDTIVRNYPKYFNQKSSIKIYEYHKISNYFDHSKLWPKKNRIITKKLLSKFNQIDFLQILKKSFGNFYISNEQFSEHEEVYWRIVRPNNNEDIGSLHADKWFWDKKSNSKFYESQKRIKVWIPLYCDGMSTGFCYVPKSHKDEINYKILKERHRTKFLIKNVDKLKIKKHIANPGNAIIFHDNLIHGGYSIDNLTRVSLEFTMILQN